MNTTATKPTASYIGHPLSTELIALSLELVKETPDRTEGNRLVYERELYDTPYTIVLDKRGHRLVEIHNTLQPHIRVSEDAWLRHMVDQHLGDLLTMADSKLLAAKQPVNEIVFNARVAGWELTLHYKMEGGPWLKLVDWKWNNE